MAKKVALSFDEQDIINIEMIVTDADHEAALELIKELKHRLDVAQRSICGQGVGTSSTI